MLRNRFIRAFLFAVMLLAFIGGVIHLFTLRFETGDVYPVYSSLRSDPLGTRVLYESIGNLEDISVRRNYQPLRISQIEPETTLLIIGAQAEGWEWISEDFIKVIDRLTDTGGRLIISFLPVKEKMTATEKTAFSRNNTAQEDDGELRQNCGTEDSEGIRGEESNGKDRIEKRRLKERGSRTDIDEYKRNRFISIKAHWGVGYIFNETIQSQHKSKFDLLARSDVDGYPEAITWHTNLYFDVRDDKWRVLYACDGYPVMIERPFGKGSVVMSTGSFFLSNEALWSDRHPDLLVGLIGRNTNVVFDEVHFGITKRPGVAGLIRKFRFQWFFAGLILLALLFVWKNSVYFVPPNTNDRSNVKDVRSDKDFAQGFTALLRRNIPTGELLQVCIREWKETVRGNRLISEQKLEDINAILERQSDRSNKQKDPVGEYQKMCGIISKDNQYE